MNTWSKSLLLTALLATIAIHGSEVERTKAEQTDLDLELYHAASFPDAAQVQRLISQKANVNCDFPPIPDDIRYVWDDISYVWARRPLVRTLWSMEYCIEKNNQDRAQLYLKMVELLLQHGANPNVTLSATTDSRAFENHVKWAYLNRFYLAPRLAPAYTALALLLTHGATTDIDLYAFPCGIHALAENSPELQRILKEHSTKLKKEITNTTPLSPDTTGVVVQYLV